jgi:hypothetical protein
LPALQPAYARDKVYLNTDISLVALAITGAEISIGGFNEMAMQLALHGLGMLG